MAAPRKFDHEEARRLRANGYSVADIASMFDVTKGSVSQATMDVVVVDRPKLPQTFAEMADLAAQDMWTYFHTAQGVAKVQAYKAIRDLAEREAEATIDTEPAPSIADVVTGVAALSPDRKREILTAERDRLREEAAAVDDALAHMDEMGTI